MRTFNEFVNKKLRESKRHLKITKKIFEKNNWKVIDHLHDSKDPHIYVRAPQNNLTFDGVRIYEIANTLAFRIQREEKTHPYGRAYYLNLEEMFSDFMSENIKEEEAGKKVIEAAVEELRDFFEKSYEAEKDLQHSQIDTDRGILPSSTTGTDYTSTMQSSTWGSSMSR
jgi:hypothetical protein